MILAAGCPGSDNPAGASGASGNAGQSGAAGADANDWDPVWHETEPEAWETVGPENNPDCGPGCRVALNVPAGNPTGIGHAGGTEFIASGGPLGQAFARLGESVTSIVPRGDPKFALMRQGIWGHLLSATRVKGIGRGQVEVINLITGETKIAFSYDSGQHNALLTAMGPNHVYWEYEGSGTMSRNLTTGEVRVLKPGGSWKMIGVEQGLLYENGKIYLADPETGDVAKVDSGSALQKDLACSPNRKQCAWIDFRDPPGHTSIQEKMLGGEVYVLDLGSGESQRVTFDSPDAPRGKRSPAVDGSLVVWNEEDEVRVEPTATSAFLAKTLARLDLATGERCRLTSPSPLQVGYKVLHGRHMYGSWLDPVQNQTWIVDIDLDDPELVWECAPSQRAQ